MLKMQVKPTAETMDECLADMANIDVDDLYCSAEPLLSDDIWKKFEFDFPLSDLSSLDEIFNDIEAAIPDTFALHNLPELCEIRNHDCMWAGHCGSKEHPAELRASQKLVNKLRASAEVVAPGSEKTPAVKQQPVAAGRSLLLKTVIKAPPPVPVLPSPESPPISDDEDPKGQTSTLKMLNDAINECDIEEDSDLCEYFKEGEDIVVDPEEEDEQPPQPKPQFTVESDHSYHDHSYHKDKNASMRMANLGIETPSDSEEEIDVVSIGEKQNVINNRLAYALPTNPSSRDRQQLQRTVASAITNKRMPSSGIKTLPPVRKCSSGESTPTKKRLPDSRGIKRAKHYYRSTASHQPSKRRAIQPANSSDSEPESEKRSLHNNMERQRRIDLRNAFEDLRMLVPEVSLRERAAKVVILREAALYCDYLGDTSEGMERKVEELRRRQQQLRGRVSQLRRSLAAKR